MQYVRSQIQCSIFMMAALLVLGLSACKGGGGSGATAPVSTVSFNTVGNTNLGIVLGGTVKAYKWMANGSEGLMLAQAVTDLQGNFALNFVNYSGPVLLALTDPNGTAVFVDEFTGAQTPFPAGKVYRSLMFQAGPGPVAVTPLTELVVIAAMKKVAVGMAQTQAIAEASREIGQAFLNGADPLYVLPWDLRRDTAGASPQSLQYAVVLAGIQRLASISGVTAFDIVLAYASKMFNASGVAGNLPVADIAVLNTEITNYQNSPPLGLYAASNVILPGGVTGLTLVANPQHISTAENAPVPVTLTATNPMGKRLTYAITTQPLNGVLSGMTPNLTYTPNMGYFGSDSFTFQAADGVDLSTASVNLNILQVLGATPVASDGSATTPEDASVAGFLHAVDPDNEPLKFAIATAPAPAQGTVTITNPVTGEYLFSPAANFNGTASFTFTASDVHAPAPGSTSNAATVTIMVQAVNDAPAASSLNASLAEDSPTPVTLIGSDLDLDPISYLLVSQPANGSLSGIGQALTYTPNANYNGPDNFTYKVNDGTVDSPIATVLLNITPVNDPPVADSQSVTVLPKTAISINLTATDVDGDPLTYTLTGGPLLGTLQGAVINQPGSGSFSYLPYTATINNQTDTITFTASDGISSSPAVTVTLNLAGYFNSNADTDGDGLLDRDEVNLYVTNPELADTDGDGFSDAEEVALNPLSINYRFNPLIADIPQLDFMLVGSPSVAIDMTTTDGLSKTFTNTSGTSASNSITNTRGISNSSATELGLMVGASLSVMVGAEADVSLTPGVKVKSEITGTVYGEASWNQSKEQTVTRGQERSLENTQMSEQSEEFGSTHEISQSGGYVYTSGRVINSGDISFTVKNLFLSAYHLDPLKGNTLNDQFVMIGNQSFDKGTLAGGFPAFTLGPGQQTGVINFTTSKLDLATALDALNGSNSISIQVASSELLDASGVPYAHTYANIAAQDALIIVDYGPGSGLNRIKKHVSVNNIPGSHMQTLQSILTRSLGLTVTNAPVSNQLSGISGINNKPPVSPATTTSQHWIVVHGQYQPDGTRISTVYTNPNTAWPLDPAITVDQSYRYGIDLSQIMVKAGDVVSLTYLIDSDGDTVTDREEVLLGTLGKGNDSDGDGLPDIDELKGWSVTVTDTAGNTLRTEHVKSFPSIADSDGDGLWDGEEAGYPVSATQTNPGDRAVDITLGKVAANIGNPGKMDTDGDWIPDSLDLQPHQMTSIDITMHARNDLTGHVYLDWSWTNLVAGSAYKAGTLFKAYIYKQYSNTGVFSKALEKPVVTYDTRFNATPSPSLRCQNGLNCWTLLDQIDLTTQSGSVLDLNAFNPSLTNEEIHYIAFISVEKPNPDSISLHVSSVRPGLTYSGQDTLRFQANSVTGQYLSAYTGYVPGYTAFHPAVFLRSYREYNGSRSDYINAKSWPVIQAQKNTYGLITMNSVVDIDDPSKSKPLAITRKGSKIDGICYGFEMNVFDSIPSPPVIPLGWQPEAGSHPAQEIYGQAEPYRPKYLHRDYNHKDGFVAPFVRMDHLKICYNGNTDLWTPVPIGSTADSTYKGTVAPSIGFTPTAVPTTMTYTSSVINYSLQLLHATNTPTTTRFIANGVPPSIQPSPPGNLGAGGYFRRLTETYNMHIHGALSVTRQ